MSRVQWFSAVLVTALFSSCGTNDKNASASIKMAPPGAPSEKEVSLNVVFSNEPGYAPDPDMYWVFHGPVYHVEVNRDVTLGRLWEGTRKLGHLHCTGNFTTIQCDDMTTGGRLYKFIAVKAADHPRIFAYAMLKIGGGGGGWQPPQPIDESPWLIGKHLELRDDAMVMDAMSRAAQNLQLEGRTVACAQLQDQALKLFEDRGIIYPSATEADRLFISLRGELLKTYGLCY